MYAKWIRRQRKLDRRRRGMRVSGKSVLLLARLKRRPKRGRRH